MLLCTFFIVLSCLSIYYYDLSAIIVISGNFNCATLTTTLPTIKHFVNGKTMENKTLNLLYAKIKEANSSIALPSLADHIITWSTWSHSINSSPAAISDHQNCPNVITGILLLCIIDHIIFCIDSVITTKTLHGLPNNKPWVTKDIKESLNKKKVAFRSGDKGEMKKVQLELSEKFKEGKEYYRRKLEEMPTKEHQGGVEWHETWKKTEQEIEGPFLCQWGKSVLNGFDDIISAQPFPSSPTTHTPSAPSHNHLPFSCLQEKATNTLSDYGSV